MGLLQCAGLAALRPIGLIDAEEFDFHALGRDRRRIDDDKRTIGAGRLLVKCSRCEFLARARRSDDQHAAVCGGDAFNRLAQLPDRGGTPDQGRRDRRKLLELLDLALEAGIFQGPVGDQHQPVGLERLFDEIVGAELDGGDGSLDIAVAGNHDHRKLGVFLLHGIKQLQPVELAALQPDIEEDQVRTACSIAASASSLLRAVRVT